MKKGKELTYAYKRHYAVDSHQGLVLGGCSSSASAHDSKYLGPLLEKLDLPPQTKASIYADKAYSGLPNAQALKTLGLKDRIQHKGSISRL